LITITLSKCDIIEKDVIATKIIIVTVQFFGYFLATPTLVGLVVALLEGALQQLSLLGGFELAAN